VLCLREVLISSPLSPAMLPREELASLDDALEYVLLLVELPLRTRLPRLEGAGEGGAGREECNEEAREFLLLGVESGRRSEVTVIV
jgi:hypothetical protein